jgi:hypothetical protein
MDRGLGIVRNAPMLKEENQIQVEHVEQVHHDINASLINSTTSMIEPGLMKEDYFAMPARLSMSQKREQFQKDQTKMLE